MITLKNYISLFVISSLTVLVACSGEQDEVMLPKADVVIAEVNGESISLYEVNEVLANVVGQKNPRHVDVEAKKKIAETLVLSKLIVQEAKKTLPPEVLAQIDFKADYFREQQIIKTYLNKHAKPKLVSNEAVVKYYQENPGKFGAKTIKEYELLTTGEVNEQTRENTLKQLNTAANEKDWAKLATHIKKAGIEINYSKGKSDSQILTKNIQTVINSTAVGKNSRPILLDNKFYLARVTSENKIPPKPFKDVSLKIQKMLQPKELKKSIDVVREGLKKDADISYHYQNLSE